VDATIAFASSAVALLSAFVAALPERDRDVAHPQLGASARRERVVREEDLHGTRTGAAAKAGHNLLIQVTAWRATLEVGEDPASPLRPSREN
jgi:hypothetical protein